MEGFVAAAMGSLILLGLVPHSFELSGPAGLGAFVLGALIPLGLERAARKLAGRAHLLALVLGFCSLGIHSVLDGGALALGLGGETGSLVIALHRLVEGLAVWWLYAREKQGAVPAVLTLLGLSACLWAGYAVSDPARFESRSLGVFQGLVAGLLAHAVWHSPRLERGPALFFGAGLGILAGFLFWVMHGFTSHTP